jgi:hypothetical protein
VRGEEAVRADKPKSSTISSAYSRRNNIIVERMVCILVRPVLVDSWFIPLYKFYLIAAE